MQYIILAYAICGVYLLRCDAYEEGFQAGWRALAAVIDKQLEEGTE